MLGALKKLEEPYNICDTRSFLLQDDQEPKDPKFSPDGGYIPRVLFMGKSVAFGSQLNKDLAKTYKLKTQGAQWLSGRVLDSRSRGCGFEPHRHYWVVVLEQDTFILA